jgi:hypothetical protein
LKLVQENLSQKQSIVTIENLNASRATIANVDHDPEHGFGDHARRCGADLLFQWFECSIGIPAGRHDRHGSKSVNVFIS